MLSSSDGKGFYIMKFLKFHSLALAFSHKICILRAWVISWHEFCKAKANLRQDEGQGGSLGLRFCSVTLHKKCASCPLVTKAMEGSSLEENSFQDHFDRRGLGKTAECFWRMHACVASLERNISQQTLLPSLSFEEKLEK